VAVDHPGELVGFDCFHVGRLSGTAGRVWQYTAIDLASSYVWAELATTPLNPSARNTSALARRVAADLAAMGWALEGVLSDNGSEFRSQEFGATLRELGARQRFIHPGRPTTNGAVERVQRTILAGVLAAILCAQPRAQDRRACPGPRGPTRASTTRSGPTPGD
jgi:transposase InsO family protein